MPIIAASKLTELVTAIMHGAGCGESEAATIARRLVDSNLVGHDSHGVLRVPRYRLDQDGTLRPNTAPTLVFDSETIAIVDGNPASARSPASSPPSLVSRRRAQRASR
jgi:uncharacterized oxidoreductase